MHEKCFSDIVLGDIRPLTSNSGRVKLVSVNRKYWKRKLWQILFHQGLYVESLKLDLEGMHKIILAN